MDINKICEEIIADITGKASISEILLKAQILSSALGIQEFKQWVSNEQRGYDKPLEVPIYRQLRCNVTALLTIPFHATQTEMNVPVDAIQHRGAQQMLSTVYYSEPAIEAERVAVISNESLIRKPTPAMGHQFVQELFPNAHVEAVYQDLSLSSFSSLVETVKSMILNFILQLDKAGEIELTLSPPINKEEVSKVFLQTITNSIVNNGEGKIEADNIIMLSPDTLSESDVQVLKTLFSRLNVLIGEEKDSMLKETAADLNSELQSPTPRKSLIKKSLAIIKGLAMGVASSEIATIINAALGVLQ